MTEAPRPLPDLPPVPELASPSPEPAAGGWLNTSLGEYGGGYYGFVALLTFLVLEIRTLHGEWRDADGLRDFLTELGFEVLIGFSVESMLNGVWAAIWPVQWYSHFGVQAAWLALIAWLAYLGLAKLFGEWLPALREVEDEAEETDAGTSG